MSQFKRGSKWVAKFQRDGEQVWVPGGPWRSKSAAREAERRYRDLLTSRRSAETCASFAERWVREWPRDADATRLIYENAAKRFAEHFGPTPLGEVEHLSARTWALSVPRRLSAVIATMYEDARKVGLVESNPFSNLRLPTSKTEIVCPTPDEFRSLLAACLQLGGYATEFRALIQFTAWTCLRSGEVQALRHRDIEGDFIHVRRARKTTGTYGLPKSGEPRKIAYVEPARVLDQVPRREGSDLVFHSAKGKPLSHATLYHYWDKVRAPVNIERAAESRPGIRFHDLRHFGATQLLEMGFSHFDVSVQLGHNDQGALVMERYGHPSKDAALERLVAGFGAGSERIGSTAGSKAVSGWL